MKIPMLRTALTLLTSTTACFAQVDDILANAGTFKPRITVSDYYSEKVVTDVEDDFIYRSLEANPERIAITVVANLDGAETGVIDADTVLGIKAGYFEHSALLGEAEDFKPTVKRVTFPLTKDVEMPDGETREARVGTITYAWTAKHLTVTVTCSDIVGAGVSDVAATDYMGLAEAGTSVSFAGDAVDVSVNFGDATGTRRAFVKGITKTVTRGYGSIAADTYEEFDLVDVSLQGAADVTGPVVKPTFPAKPNANRTIDIAGSANDDQTIVKLDSITINGIETSPADVGSEDTDEGLWNWSVAGLPLVKGKNVVVLTFSDEDGNVTLATRTYVPDGKGPVVKAIFPTAPNSTGAINITGTADDVSIVTLDAITVNGVAATPATLGTGDNGTELWNWSVGGLQLAKGRNVVLLTFSDDEGNLTKVTRTYTLK